MDIAKKYLSILSWERSVIFFRDGISKFIILFPLTLVLLNKQFMNPLTYDQSKLIKFLKKKLIP